MTDIDMHPQIEEVDPGEDVDDSQQDGSFFFLAILLTM